MAAPGLAPYVNAAKGVAAAWRQERHVRFHVWAAFTAALVGVAVDLSAAETLWLLATIGAVLALELVNSAMERTVDLTVGERRHPLAGLAKDMAAGAVLVMAVQAAIGGVLIFAVWRSPWATLGALWRTLQDHPAWGYPTAGLWCLLTLVSLATGWRTRGV